MAPTTASELSTTRAAILGQLALREWSAYELTRSMRRSVHWFWPRAESVIYAEAKRLIADGFATSRDEPSGTASRRRRTVYSITDAGREGLAAWLQTTPSMLVWQNEPLLRVHLGRFGSRDDLHATIGWAEQVAEALLSDADAVATEFVEGRHLFQDEAHLRGLLFDALASNGRALQDWARHARAEVERWTDINADEAARLRAVARMREHLRSRATSPR